MLEDAGLALAERLDQRRQMAGGNDPADANGHRIGVCRGQSENAGQHQAQNGPASVHPRFHPIACLFPEPSRAAALAHGRSSALEYGTQPWEERMASLQDKAVLVTGPRAALGRPTPLPLPPQAAVIAPPAIHS